MPELGITAIEQTEHSVTFTRSFKAPKELVFSMFTSGDRIAQWWGPTHWPVTVSTMDFSVGGVWHYCMQGPDGTQSWGVATYQEIDEPNKIVWKDAFSNENGEVNTELPVGVMTVLLTEDDGITTLASSAEYSEDGKVAELMEMGIAEGFKDIMDQLDTLVTVAQA